MDATLSPPADFLAKAEQRPSPASDAVLQLRGLELMAGVAHDMRAPLATITTSAELLELEIDATSEQPSHLIKVIQRQAFRLQQMIQDVTDYIRQPQERVCLRRENADLVGLVRDLAWELQHVHGTHCVEVQTPEEPVLACVDVEKVRRILQNLLGNALQYSPRGSRVTVRLTQQGCGDAVLEVEDEGPGVPEHARHRVFEPFVRLGNGGSGQGLGLHIVRRFTEAHGGRVWVETGTVGARFCVALPVS